MTQQNNIDPGEGAVSFAKELARGMSRSEAAEMVDDLMRGKLPAESSLDTRRVKRCKHCGYYYLDKTRPNNSKTCSAGCKTKRDTARRRKQTEEKRKQGLKKFVKPTIMERSYNNRTEYPYWAGDGYKYDVDKSMEAGLSNYEQPYRNIEEIYAAKQRDATIGGRKRHASERAKDYYNGDWNNGFK